MEKDKALAKPKRAGRRSKSLDGESQSIVSREDIIRLALKIAKKEAVDAITIMRLSRELDVTPSLIHYLIGGRDKLLTAVLNEAMKQDSPKIKTTGKWDVDLETVMREAFKFQMKWRGITTYLHTHNKHRLFQDTQPGEIDHGLAFFNTVGEILKKSGMPADKAAMAYHLLMLFVTSAAFTHINNQEPASHSTFLKAQVKHVESANFNGAAFLLPEFAKLTTPMTFDVGLSLLLKTISEWVA